MGLCAQPCRQTAFSELCPNFQGRNQQDVQEALQALLDHLHEDVKQQVEIPRTPPEKMSDEELARAAWSAEGESTLNGIFQGLNWQVMRCNSCRFETRMKFTRSLMTIAYLPKSVSSYNGGLSLVQCLDATFADEEVDWCVISFESGVDPLQEVRQMQEDRRKDV